MSRIESEVVSETEDTQSSAEMDTSIDGFEETSCAFDREDGKAENCQNCDKLAKKVTRLQKKVSWLKRSKQKLQESILNEVMYSNYEVMYSYYS